MGYLGTVSRDCYYTKHFGLLSSSREVRRFIQKGLVNNEDDDYLMELNGLNIRLQELLKTDDGIQQIKDGTSGLEGRDSEIAKVLGFVRSHVSGPCGII